MAQSPQTKRRPVGAAVLAIPLLALLVLAGVGTAVSLREGARAERVRGLVPFTAALTTLVHDLQRERSLSATRVAAAGQEAGVAGPALEGGQGAGAALDAARRAVDGAAARYRDAAVRLDISDRDRGLHQRLDAGLTELAGLTALRTTVDNPVPRDPAAASATVFRRYTTIVGGLLAVDGEIGLREADQDAELLRAVTAASAFARAGELADRERAAAARAAATGHLEQADRTRLAALGGRQDALLDQFGSLASPGQLRRYAQAMPPAETERIERLRRAALEGGPGADLAAWSRTATTRSGRMRQVERSLTAEVARLATLADRDADRRAIAYGGVLLLTACTVAVLLVLASSRARRSRTQEAVPEARPRATAPTPGRNAAPTLGTSDPHPPIPGTPEPPLPVLGPPDREGSSAGNAAAAVVHTPTPLGGAPSGNTPTPVGAAPTGQLPGREGAGSLGQASPATVSGLAYLARRSQDLADQQLELLDRTGRDQRDPRLPGRLLQIDRLAVRARRNAHNLIVLSGGEPGRQWSGPAPLAEVVAAAVSDNPDAARIDLAVGDDLLVPGEAADDLANLLAELVDNATAFSAPETRVEVRGQKVGSGYVLEVEDRGLGMTDGELETVNRHLAGDPVAGEDLEQQLGTWVAGRLAERHQVRVQLRRSSSGGVTALVFFPEWLLAAPEGAPEPQPPVPGPPIREGSPAGSDAAPVVHSLPPRRYVTQVPEGEQPLPRRAPHTSLAPDLAAADPGAPARRPGPEVRPGDPGRPGDHPTRRPGPDVRSGDPAPRPASDAGPGDPARRPRPDAGSGDPTPRPAPDARPGGRSPEQVRSMLTRYRSGLERGRAAAARDLPDDPDDDPAA